VWEPTARAIRGTWTPTGGTRLRRAWPTEAASLWEGLVNTEQQEGGLGASSSFPTIPQHNHIIHPCFVQVSEFPKESLRQAGLDATSVTPVVPAVYFLSKALGSKSVILALQSILSGLPEELRSPQIDALHYLSVPNKGSGKTLVMLCNTLHCNT